MAEQKMDWNDFVQRANDQYGTSDEDWDQFRDSAIVRFDYDDRGYVSGRYRGKIVYRDKHYENEIQPGEVWIVSLTLNPSSGSNYFAKPIQRIDASFMFELKKEQIDEISDYIWREHRSVLEPIIEERYREVMAEQITSAKNEVARQYDATVNDLLERISDLEKTHSEDQRIIDSQENRMEEMRTCTPAPAAVQTQAAPERRDVPAQMQELSVPKYVVIRTGPDTICSDGFNKARYYVHLSADHRFIVVRPDQRGNVVCMENTMVLSGLNTVAPFTEETELATEYSHRFGGVQIFLK